MTDRNVNMIAYCGLDCAGCFAYTGTIADMARDLRKELRQAKFQRMAEFLATVPFFKAYKNYDQCYEVLGAMVKFRCGKGCRGGGGSPACKMRKCCQQKGLEGCWQCADFETCEKLDYLKPGHGDEHIKNLKKLRKASL